MSETPIRILIVDDSPEDREVFRRFLLNGTDGKYEVIEAETGEQGYSKYCSERPDCVLLDYHLPDANGLEILERLNAERDASSMTVVMLTGAGDETVAVRAMKGGAQDYDHTGVYQIIEPPSKLAFTWISAGTSRVCKIVTLAGKPSNQLWTF